MPRSKVAILGMVITPGNRNPHNREMNPYYWVDDHPLLYGNNGSLDTGTHQNLPQHLTQARRQSFLTRRGPAESPPEESEAGGSEAR